jgi:CRP-like cAMP-binding protein
MLKTIEKALLLQELGILQFASADHLMQLAEAGREEVFRKGESIVRVGEPSRTLYLLLIGRAAKEGTGGGATEKADVNLCACLSGAAQSFNCVCLEDCTVLAMDTSDLLDLLAGEPELSLALLKYFASKQPQSI